MKMNEANERSMEEEKLALERFRIENELALAREKLTLERERLDGEINRRSISPVTATVFAALLGVLGTTFGIFWQGRTNTQLKRRKFEYSLVQRAFEIRDQGTAANFLSFMAQTEVVEDSALRLAISKYIEKPQLIPFLPTSACEKLTFDLNTGTLNNLPPTASQEQVKRFVPCWTGDTPDGSDFNQGGGVFFTNHDFYFYTWRRYIEVRLGFNGSVSPSFLGEKAEVLRINLGEPRTIAEHPEDWYFERKYGCLRVEFKDNIVHELAAHSEKCDEVISWYPASK
jgi:hypothetical protein